jgi:hypothetical protein
MPGLLSPRNQGLLQGAPRQVSVPGAQPQSAGWMMAGSAGGPPAVGSDEWALTTGGPGAMVWRELMRGLQSQGIGALAPGNAGKVFSPEFRALLGPAYQKGGGK